MKNYYAVLGLKSSAVSVDDIRRAYRQLMLHCHPDRVHYPEAVTWARELNEAYEVLRSDKRAQYDERLRRHNPAFFA